MSNVKLFLVLAFVMVCAAGAGVGMIVDQRLRPIPPVVDHPRGPMEELKLTPDQRAKIGPIWSEVKRLRDKRLPDHQEFAKKRDGDIAALLTTEQKAAYDKIQASYHASMKESDDALQQAVHKAELETHAILTPEQQAHYDEIGKRFGRPGNGRRGGPRNRDRDHNRSTTQPSTMPAQMTSSADGVR
jgi:Spy/CpxP family protein refolding chaperone